LQRLAEANEVRSRGGSDGTDEDVGGFLSRARHVGHLLEWVRTLVSCAILCIQVYLLTRG
jgi:hypothetical protein